MRIIIGCVQKLTPIHYIHSSIITNTSSDGDEAMKWMINIVRALILWHWFCEKRMWIQKRYEYVFEGFYFVQNNEV